MGKELPWAARDEDEPVAVLATDVVPVGVVVMAADAGGGTRGCCWGVEMEEVMVEEHEAEAAAIPITLDAKGVAVAVVLVVGTDQVAEAPGPAGLALVADARP